MKKKLFALLLTLCMVLTLLPVTASAASVVNTGACGDDAEWTLYDDGTIIISGTGAMNNYNRGGTPWHSHYAAITRVEIQEGITAVGSNSFNFYGSKITSVSFPSTLTSIGGSAFWDGTRITELVIPDNVTSIGGGAFYNCYSVESVKLPSKLVSLGDSAFEICRALETVALPDTLTSIGKSAFKNCSGLKTVSIPSSVTELKSDTFSGCTSLQSISLPAGMTRIDSYAFHGCSALRQITLPENLTYLGHNAFQGSGLTAISIPDGVSAIQSRTFMECDALTDVTLGSGITRIYDEAFRDAGVRHITFPAALTRIDRDAFIYCDLLSAHFLGDFPTLGSNAIGHNPVIYYPCNNPTWTEQKMNSYKPSISPYSARYYPWHQSVNYLCTVCGEPDLTVEGITRIAGQSRYDTSFLIADTLKQRLAVDKFAAAIVTSGENFADALAGSYLAYLKSAPILLTDNDNIADVMDYIRENVAAGGTVYALGGAAVVTDELQSITSDGFVFKRLAGATRFETNLEILKECGDLSGQEFLICTGYNFADSLSASAARRPIMLVDDALSAQQKAFFSQLGSCEFWVVGGTGAVSETVEQQVRQYNQYGEVTRLRGTNRYDTSSTVGEWLYDAPLSVVFAYGDNFPDGLCAGPLAATLNVPLLLVDNGDPRWAQLHVSDFDCSGGYVLGGPTLIGDDTIREIFKWSKNSPFNN